MASGLFRFCWFLCALLTTGWTTPASAGAGSVGEPVEVCVRRDEPGLNMRALLRRPVGFRCDLPQTAWGPGDYLVVSEPLSVGAHWPARVRSGSVWQDATTIHALYADGGIWSVRTDSVGASDRIQLGAMLEHKLPVRGVPVVRLLWRVEGAANLRAIVVDPRVARPSESAESNLILAGFYAAFGGLCFALLVYNLALWAALRHRFQFDYCVMVLALLAYAATSSGAIAWVWPGLDNNARLRANYIALSVSAAAALGFARSFFERRVFEGWLDRLSSIVTWTLLAAGIAFAALAHLAPKPLDRLYAASFALLILLVPAILWRAWNRRSNYLLLFSIGWAVPVLFAGMRIAHNFDLVGWSFWLDNSTVLAMTVEALLSSLAIAYRINQLSRDRDRARSAETAALLLADIDPLTDVLNRRAFLRAAIGRSGEQVLLLVDVDHFKRVNDTVGHDTGDEVLRAVARALAAAVPPDALVARVGGEEFAVVASARTAPDPAAVLAALRAEPMPFDLKVTASIGVAHGPLADEADWKTLYRDADRALLDAKRSGRDRVRRAFAAAA